MEKDGFTGWDGLAYRSDTPNRTNADGALDTPTYKEPRIVNIKGYALASQPEQLESLRSKFLSVGESTLVVQRPWGTQWAPKAKIVERRFDEIGGLPRAKFLLALKFPDPLKFGNQEDVSLNVGQSKPIFHRGTEPAWPMVTVTGSMTGGYTVTLRGQKVTVPTGIFAGETHRIDYRTRRLYINGQLSMGLFGADSFVPVLPGPRQDVSLSAPSGSGTAVVVVTDTYT